MSMCVQIPWESDTVDTVGVQQRSPDAPDLGPQVVVSLLMWECNSGLPLEVHTLSLATEPFLPASR